MGLVVQVTEHVPPRAPLMRAPHDGQEQPAGRLWYRRRPTWSTSSKSSWSGHIPSSRPQTAESCPIPNDSWTPSSPEANSRISSASSASPLRSLAVPNDLALAADPSDVSLDSIARLRFGPRPHQRTSSRHLAMGKNAPMGVPSKPSTENMRPSLRPRTASSASPLPLWTHSHSSSSSSPSRQVSFPYLQHQLERLGRGLGKRPATAVDVEDICYVAEPLRYDSLISRDGPALLFEVDR